LSSEDLLVSGYMHTRETGDIWYARLLLDPCLLP
jgi:hypothetical protein